MADENGDKECTCSWMDKAKAICLVIAALTTATGSITAAVFGALNRQTGLSNGQKLEAVETKQDDAHVITHQKLDKIDAEANKAAITVDAIKKSTDKH